jgi:glycosyltransferase involved in cell wall biosynthesis
LAPRRVLYLHSSAGRYGADRQLHLLCTTLDPERYHPLVVLPFEGPLAEDLRRDGVEVLTGPLAVLRREHMSVLGLSRLTREIAYQRFSIERLVRAQAIDVVHANTSVILGAAKAARAVGARYVVHVREIYPPKPVLWPWHRRGLRAADAVLCVSRATRTPIGDGPNVHVVHDGLAALHSPTPRPQARLALGLPQHAFVVAVLGRISGWKGQAVLARALARDAMRMRGAIGVVAGDAWPGQEHWQDELQAAAAGLGDRFRLLGFRRDVETVLGAADVVVVPSTQPDPLPNSALEAAAAGCCVVASSSGGLSEILRDGHTGVLVPPDDDEALARALAALADDPARRAALGAAAALDVRDRFAPERLAPRVMAIYDALLAVPAPTTQ